MDEWHRSDNAGSILLYTLKQHGWRKGEPVMVNDVMIRIENANGSTNDIDALARTILAALTPASDGRAEALLAEAVEALKRLHQWSEAYPVEVFPEPDFVAVRAALESAGLTLDAISASNMRHVLKGVGDITSAILARINIKEAKDNG